MITIVLASVSINYSGTSLTRPLWDQRVFELVKCSSYRTHDVISLMCTLYTHYSFILYTNLVSSALKKSEIVFCFNLVLLLRAAVE